MVFWIFIQLAHLFIFIKLHVPKFNVLLVHISCWICFRQLSTGFHLIILPQTLEHYYIFYLNIFLPISGKHNHFPFLIFPGPAVAQSVEYSAPDRRARVRGSPGEKPPCTLMAPGVCKIRRECNVLEVPIQIIPLWV